MEEFNPGIIGYNQLIYIAKSFALANINVNECESNSITVPNIFILIGPDGTCKESILRYIKEYIEKYNDNLTISIITTTIFETDIGSIINENISDMEEKGIKRICLIAIDESDNDKIRSIKELEDKYKNVWIEITKCDLNVLDCIAIAKKALSKNIHFESDRSIEFFSHLMFAQSWNDILNMINYAKIISINENIDTHKALFKSYLVYVMYKNFTKYDREELYEVAIHEAGHALMTLYYGFEVSLIEISSGDLCGTTQTSYIDRSAIDYEDAIKRIDIALAGGISRKVIIGKDAMGNNSDIKACINRFIDIAESGNLSIYNDKDITTPYRNIFTEDMPTVNDDIIKNSIAYNMELRSAFVYDVLSKNAEIIKALAKALVESDVLALDGIEIEKIVNDCGGIVHDV